MDDDGKVLAYSLALINHIEVWCSCTGDACDYADPWQEGYDEAHRELALLIRGVADPCVLRAARQYRQPGVHRAVVVTRVSRT